MPLRLNSPGWRIAGNGASRGTVRAASAALPPLPADFVPDHASVEEVILQPAPASRAAVQASAGVDLSCDVEPGQAAILVVRHPSGALTFHPPVESTTASVRGRTQVRFQLTVRQRSTRGLIDQAVKAIIVKVAKVGVDKLVSFVLPKLVEGFERGLWKKRGLTEGWLKVARETLGGGKLEAGKPLSGDRTLLFIHGTFSNTASAFKDLAKSGFFDRVKALYEDRIFGFDHFTLSKTPEENVRMLLEALSEPATTFDVITHSRGGLVLRTLVERADEFGVFSKRFKLGRAVLVASPNDGTPLATPKRWEDTIGWVANLLELFPDNPFTTGPAFVAEGLVWLANHASGDIPGLRAMDAEAETITILQKPPGPPPNAYSALVANYQPKGNALDRLLDIGLDQFFGSANDLVVPSEGGWRIDHSGTAFIPGARIGCFGPGGNLSLDSVTHVSFFSRPETTEFLVNALSGRQQALHAVDLRKALPDRQLLRGVAGESAAVQPAELTRAQAAAEAAARSKARPAEKPLRITIINGDLTFEPEPLLLGHYRSMRLTGTESVMDKLIGGAMSHSLRMGLYPTAIGSHQIFFNTRPNLERGSVLPRPKAVIVVGLGNEGVLQAAQLASTVRQAVVAWAQRLAEDKNRPRFFELAATLIGSGGTGVGAGEAARLVAQGVCEANDLLDKPYQNARWPRVSDLRLIELYLDRATEAWRSLRLQEAATPGRFEVAGSIQICDGALPRPADSGYRGAEYDFISVETRKDKDGTPLIAFTLDTRRARSEVRGQRTQSELIRELVETASNDQNRDERIGRTLFDLLIPPELEAYLVGSGEMQIELDPENAGIPWELLDTNDDAAADQRPWAIRAKLLRKLRVQGGRDLVTDADTEAHVLIIGEPECTKEYPRLYGARWEAVAVQEALGGPAGLDPTRIQALISADPTAVGSDARTVINALFERPWRIVHIAGHGALRGHGKPGGVVLSNGSFLGPDEIRNLRVVPELVFVNCCHLASGDPGQLLHPGFDRAGFAAGVAGALIEIGVRCVVAAGWAVDDDAAMIFAKTFYASLLRGNRFIEAVGEARQEAYILRPEVNTWAAYQCYGDPDWIFRRQASDADTPTASPDEDYSNVGSPPALRLALERIIVRTKFQGRSPAQQGENVKQLENLYGEKWGSIGTVAEFFAAASIEVGAIENGVRWYERAVAADDRTASIKAAEQLANVRGRLGWEIVDRAQRVRDEKQRRLSGTPARDAKSRAAAQRELDDAERNLRQSIRAASRHVSKSLRLLKKLQAIQNTMERESLVGSAYKRQALIDVAAGRRQELERNLRRMRASYERARRIGAASGIVDLYYPESNCLVADVALNAGRRGWSGFDEELLKNIKDSLGAKKGHDANFWSVVGTIEIRQYEALAAKRLRLERGPLERAYQDLHKRVTGTQMWGSVYDTAFLIFRTYADRTSGQEKESAHALLELVRNFAHPVLASPTT